MSRRLILFLAIALILSAPAAFVAAASPDPSTPVPTADSSAGASPISGDGTETPPTGGAATVVILFVLLALGSIPAALAWRRGWRPRPGGF
jgi:hypothetical protein